MDITCTMCSGTGHILNQDCQICHQGIIPAKVIRFIKDKMTEREDHYLCQYNRILNDTGTLMQQITFKVDKQNYRVLGLDTGGVLGKFPTNSVAIIQTMMNDYSEGDYLLLDS